jgi:hypothetical protein
MAITIIVKKNRERSHRGVSFGSRPVPSRTFYQAPSNVAGRQLSVVIPAVEAMEAAERREYTAYLRDKLKRDDITDDAVEAKIAENHNPPDKFSAKKYVAQKADEKVRQGDRFYSTS